MQRKWRIAPEKWRFSIEKWPTYFAIRGTSRMASMGRGAKTFEQTWTYLLRGICIQNKSHNLPLILGLIYAYIFPGVGTEEAQSAQFHGGIGLLPMENHHNQWVQMMNFVFKTRKRVLKTRNCVSKTRSCVLKMMNFAAVLQTGDFDDTYPAELRLNNIGVSQNYMILY